MNSPEHDWPVQIMKLLFFIVVIALLSPATEVMAQSGPVQLKRVSPREWEMYNSSQDHDAFVEYGYTKLDISTGKSVNGSSSINIPARRTGIASVSSGYQLISVNITRVSLTGIVK
jgi:hypothetical protein